MRKDMSPDSFVRVAEMLHAIKIFIEAASKLTDKDIRNLEQIADVMTETRSTKTKEMTLDEIERAMGHPVKIVKEK